MKFHVEEEETIKMEYLNEDHWLTEKLSDCQLQTKFLEQKSVKKRMENIQSQLRPLLNQDESQVQAVLSVVMNYVIPAGTKGVVRGLEFNKIVKTILEKNLRNNMEPFFEKKCPFYETTEIPDWWIYCKENNKYVIGYNQMDLWKGGAQRNRANRYLSDDFHTSLPENVNILCVIASPIMFKQSNPQYQIFQKALEEKRLCSVSRIVETIFRLLKK